MNELDTIAAIATPSGDGGIGIIRVSGPKAFVITDQIFKPYDGLSCNTREPVSYTHLTLPTNREV